MNRACCKGQTLGGCTFPRSPQLQWNYISWSPKQFWTLENTCLWVIFSAHVWAASLLRQPFDEGTKINQNDKLQNDKLCKCHTCRVICCSWEIILSSILLGMSTCAHNTALFTVVWIEYYCHLKSTSCEELQKSFH